MTWRYLDLADFLIIAEAVLEIDALVLEKVTQTLLASSALDAPAAEFGGVEFYTEPAAKAAILCSRIIRNHALPDGNKRVAFMATVEFLERNGFSWEPPIDEAVAAMRHVASRQMDEEQLAEWITGFLGGNES